MYKEKFGFNLHDLMTVITYRIIKCVVKYCI